MLVCIPFLNTGKILAILNLSGTIPLVKDALNVICKGFHITDFKSLSKFDGIV